MNGLLKKYRADLHVHTVLSPCAEVEMIPPLIVESALDLGLQLIAITDHNATANIQSVQKAARGTGLTVLPGMELQTREEVHTLCLFDSIEQIAQLQKLVDQTLPALLNQPEHFGEQFVVDETGDFIRREDRLLLTSTSLTLNEAWKFVNNLGGLFIPAHVDRKAFGLLANLGLVPSDIPLDALEISRHVVPAAAPVKFPQIMGFPLIQDGDAHRLNEINNTMLFQIAEPSINEIQLALKNQLERKILFE